MSVIMGSTGQMAVLCPSRPRVNLTMCLHSRQNQETGDQLIGELVALAEGAGSGLCTHVLAHSPLYLQFQGFPLLMPPRAAGTHELHTCTRRQNTQTHEIRRNKMLNGVKSCICQACWHTPLILALRTQRQVNLCELQASLVHT